MDINLDQLEVVHNTERKRFEIQLGEQMALVSYIVGSSEIIFTHTEVPRSYQGLGVAAKLTKVALDYAREQGMRIRPICQYTAAYIKRHPEYQPITAGY